MVGTQLPVRALLLLTVLVMLMFSAALAGLYFYEPPSGAREAVAILTGSLASALGMVLGFWFSTSLSSARKTDALAQSTPAHQ